MNSKDQIMTKNWIEISKSALLENLSNFKKKTGKRKIFCVVKANAYGHGLDVVVKVLAKEDVFFAVDSLEEGLEIRKLGVKNPVLILGYTPLSSLKVAVEKGFSLTIYSLESLKKILKHKLNRKAKVHLKLETGLNRQGLKIEKVLDLANYIEKKSDHFVLEGISTHFADIEDTLDPSYSEFQLMNFKRAIERLRKHGFIPAFKHCACSAATILYPETYFDAVRIGISLYGYWPSKETKLAYSIKHKDKFKLVPILKWKSIIAQLKEVNKGESVGYGRSWYASKNTHIAIIPVGYSDGYDRKMSNVGRVIIRHSFAPIIGRIAMNMMIVDVSNIKNVKEEDEVIIIGKDGDKEISAEEIAQKLGTINYEVVSRINPKIKRILVK